MPNETMSKRLSIPIVALVLSVMVLHSRIHTKKGNHDIRIKDGVKGITGTLG
jgi:hypothetical protein